MAAELRAIFDEDADLYDRARPGYPAALFVDLEARADLRPGSSVLEIGPGTGQATLSLVARGAQVVAVELGESLAAVLRLKTSALPVEVVVGAFEDCRLPASSFRAVVAFTSWHWLTPGLRVSRALAALAPGGSVATVTTTHVLGGTVQFFADMQACYEEWDPATEPGLRLLPAAEIPPARDELDDSAFFQPAVRRRYEQDVTYSTSGYLDILHTYSGHRALTPERRSGLMAAIAELIDTRYAGTVTKRYLHELRVARRSTT